MVPHAFLRLPPFPGHRGHAIAADGVPSRPVDPAAAIEALCRHRVGGDFWGADDPWAAGASGEDAAFVRALCEGPDAATLDLVRRTLCDRRWNDPYDGDEIGLLDLIALLGEWRRQIEANRSIRAVFGVAGWKRVTVDPLLWDGLGPVPHRARVPADLRPGERVVAWKSRTAPAVLARLEAMGARIDELEDGFIRSAGLGADCVPPLSVILDTRGIYFDPRGPSDLETLIEEAVLDAPRRRAAQAVRTRLVETGLSKYEGSDGQCLALPRDGRRRLLVVGQVEDDRSILAGGAGMTNARLLAAARAIEGPDAWIAYKPHPDVEAGHRPGAIPGRDVLAYADTIVRSGSVADWIAGCDGLHTITSLAGFEALLRGRDVTCHGVPFYAGWGLTRDLAATPARRTRECDIDTLAAATLMLYPRNVDPESRLPCGTSLLIERLASGRAEVRSLLVTARRWQGRVKRWLRRG